MGIKEREESRVTPRLWLKQGVDSDDISRDKEVWGGTDGWVERIKDVSNCTLHLIMGPSLPGQAVSEVTPQVLEKSCMESKSVSLKIYSFILIILQ